MRNMEILAIQRKLAEMMHNLNLSYEVATITLNMLKTEEQLQEMMDYIIKNEDIITDHQTLQHLAKILYEDKN